MGDLRGLLERVRAATKSSRELDADIYEALGYQIKRGPGAFKHRRTWAYYENSRWAAMAWLTYSIDDAVKLVERMLPEWSLSMILGEGLKYPAVRMGRSYPTNKSVAVEHRTLPLALVAALLSALIAQEQTP